MSKEIRVVEVPMDFYKKAKANPYVFITDVLGEATLSIKKLFDNLELFNSSLTAKVNPFDERTVTFAEWFKPPISPIEYYMHLDGSKGGDGYGVCMCHVHSWTNNRPSRPIIEVDFLGAPNRNTYGKDFDSKLLETLIEDLIFRGFRIKILTFDRATNVRVIQEFLESYGVVVAPLSIDKTAKFPLVDYSKSEPPFFKTVSTNGTYDKPMTEFRDIVNDSRLIVPFYQPYTEIPFSLEHNIDKKIVTKIAGKEDDVSQSVAGAIFNALNNSLNTAEINKKVKESYKEFEDYVPDSFEKSLAMVKSRSAVEKPNKDMSFDKADEETSEEDSFSRDIDNPFYF